MNIKRLVKNFLGLFGVQLKTVHLGYISAKKTITQAKKSGLSVGDYVEQLWGNSGGSAFVIDNLLQLDVFALKPENILEIGPGTGRYMEKVIEIVGKERNVHYEFYETASDWERYLKNTYPVESKKADGRTLSGTKDACIELVHAHGVFVYTPFLVTMNYFMEASRVLKTGGFFVFDVYTEDCFSNKNLEKWMQSSQDFPVMTSESYLMTAVERMGFTHKGSFFNAHGAGESKYFVFKKNIN